MSLAGQQRVADGDIGVGRFPPPPELAEKRRGLLEHLPCRVKASLVHERQAAQVRDPAEPSLISELAREALAVVEQFPALGEVWFVEAQDAKRPLDLALVIAFARQG